MSKSVKLSISPSKAFHCKYCGSYVFMCGPKCYGLDGHEHSCQGPSPVKHYSKEEIAELERQMDSQNK